MGGEEGVGKYIYLFRVYCNHFDSRITNYIGSYDYKEEFYCLSLHTGLAFLLWAHPHLFFLTVAVTCTGCSLSLTVHALECSHSPFPTSVVLFFHFTFPFFLPVCSLHFSAWLCDTLLKYEPYFQIRNSQGSGGMGQIGSLENFSPTSRTYGFPLCLKVQVLLPCGPIRVGVPGIPAPKLGIKVYYSDTFNIFLSSLQE